MAATKKVEINTGVEYEVYEYVWNIRNFALVQENQTRLTQEKFEIDVGKSPDVQSKWLVGLQPGYLILYFKLLEMTNDKSKISTRISVSYRLREVKEPAVNVMVNTTAVNGTVVFMIGPMTGQPASTFKSILCMDEKGTVTFNIKMELLAFQGQQSENPELVSLKELNSSSQKLLCSNYSILLSDSQSYDLKIKCSDGVVVAAHKIILSAQNPVFASMLESDLSENHTKVINDEDVTGSTMKIILHYLYTGELLSEWSQPDTVADFTYAAGKYQLTKVLEMLDSVLGNDYGSTCNLALLNLASNLCLKNAEKKLKKRIAKTSKKTAKSSKEFLALI